MSKSQPIPHPSIGRLDRVGVIGAMRLLGGGSNFAAYRNMHWDVGRHGIRGAMRRFADDCERAGVDRAEVHNPGGTDGAMSFAQVNLLQLGYPALDPINAYSLAVNDWKARFGWLPTIYAGKCEDIDGDDPQLARIGMPAAIRTLLRAFPGCPVCIDHSSRYDSRSATYRAIDGLCAAGVAVSVEPRCSGRGETRNDHRLGTFTTSPVFRRSLHESWAWPLDDCQNRVHAVLVVDGPNDPLTPVSEIRHWLAWGLDVYVPIDDRGMYQNVRAGDITP